MKHYFRYGLLASSALCLTAHTAIALPTGGVVAAGNAEIRSAGPNILVFQTTDRAVVDWQSFDVGSGEQVYFAQPSASSAILNRIHDTDASRIDGALTATGQVYLVNPNGMVFGKGAQVDVGSLVASTADISNSAFMKGGVLHFDKPGDADATIANHGTMTVKEGGLAALVAPNVSNSGMITAKAGTIALASGDTMTVDFYGDNLLSVAVSDKAKHLSSANTGTLSAQDGGTIRMTTAHASSIIDSAINMDGIANASSATKKGGVIYFGGQDATITLGKNASVKATGKTGGGTVRIGGEYQGKGNTPTAKNTKIAEGASIDASGDGGEVIVWADDTTVFAGDIKALDGFVETSGKLLLYAIGNVLAKDWLLDPTDVTISNGAGTDVSAGGTFSGSAAIDATTLQTALNNGTSVTITTNSGGGDAGDISLNNVTISKTGGGDATFTLKAEHDISFNNSTLTSSIGKLNLVLWSDSNNSGAGSMVLTNSNITTNGGNFLAGGGLDDGANSGAAGDGVPDNFAHGDALKSAGISLNGTTINSGGGNITLRGAGENAADDSNFGVAFFTGSVLQSTSGVIEVTGNAGAGNQFNYGIKMKDAGTKITSETGRIKLVGNGGSTGAAGSSRNSGIQMDQGSSVTSTGTGMNAATIRLEGTGGNGEDNNYGIELSVANTLITSKAGAISLKGTGGSNGAVGSDTNHGIYIYSDADITSTGAAGAAATITLEGTGGGGESNNKGILLSGAGTSIVSDYGNISLTGVGGNSAVLDDFNTGIGLQADADIRSTGTAANAASITLNGIAGLGDTNNRGVQITGTGTTISGIRGNISITGVGKSGGVVGSQQNHGVAIDTNAVVSTAGGGGEAGSITIDGTSGNGEDVNIGVFTTSSGLITSDKGAILLIGQGGSNGLAGSNGNTGIQFNSGGVTSTGTGTSLGAITLIGRGASAGKDNNYGVALNTAAAQISTVDANVNITGTGGGTGANNHGVYLTTDPDITSTNTGSISLTGTAGTGGTDLRSNGGVIQIGGGAAKGDIVLTFETYNFANTTFSTAGNINLKPRNATQSIGISGGAGTWQVDDALIALMTPGATSRLDIGDMTNGTGTVDVSEWNMGALGYGVGVYGGAINVHNDVGNFNIRGTYKGTTGQLNAGTGNIVATTSFDSSLNIVGSGATLSAGYIGSPLETPNQNMANRISISGLAHPFLTANPAYTFAGYIIGTTNSLGGGGPAPAPAVVPVEPATPEPTPEPPVVSDPPHTGGGGSTPTPAPPTVGSGNILPSRPVVAIAPVESGLPSTYMHPASHLRTFSRIDEGSPTFWLDISTDNIDVLYHQNKDQGESGLDRRKLYRIDSELQALLDAE